MLVLIGILKLFKALMLIEVGNGALKFLHKDAGSTVPITGLFTASWSRSSASRRSSSGS
jgi:hypothetical protein